VLPLEWDKALSTNFTFYFEVVTCQLLSLNATYARGDVVLSADVRFVVEGIKYLALTLHLYLKRCMLVINTKSETEVIQF
jgi:hypothetical protein